MFKIGDTVKVISKTKYNDEMRAFIPIGTICNIVAIEYAEDEGYYYGICPTERINDGNPYYYLEKELEKGHLEWITD